MIQYNSQMALILLDVALYAWRHKYGRTLLSSSPHAGILESHKLYPEGVSVQCVNFRLKSIQSGKLLFNTHLYLFGMTSNHAEGHSTAWIIRWSCLQLSYTRLDSTLESFPKFHIPHFHWNNSILCSSHPCSTFRNETKQPCPFLVYIPNHSPNCHGGHPINC